MTAGGLLRFQSPRAAMKCDRRFELCKHGAQSRPFGHFLKLTTGDETGPAPMADGLHQSVEDGNRRREKRCRRNDAGAAPGQRTSTRKGSKCTQSRSLDSPFVLGVVCLTPASAIYSAGGFGASV